jgi:hypothetical protein
MPQSWLDVLDALKDRAKTAYDHPDQRAALTDAAFAELTVLDDPENPGTPIVQTCAMTEGGEGGGGGGSSGGGSGGGLAFWNWDWSPVWKKYKADLGFFTDVFARMFTGRSANDPEIQQGREYLKKGEYGKAAKLVITDSAKRATSGLVNRTISKAVRPRPTVGAAASGALPSPRSSLLNEARDPRLRNAIENLYRPNAKIGSGSSMDAVRFEKATGQLLSPTGHVQKLLDRRAQLMKLLSDPALNPNDRAIVRRLLIDIQDALSR